MHDKTYKIACVPSEDSDPPGHLVSLTSLRCLHEESLGPELPIKRTAKTDQTGRLPRMICAFAGHTCHFVGFVMCWLKYNLFSLKNKDDLDCLLLLGPRLWVGRGIT